jgi:hypothetical protein
MVRERSRLAKIDLAQGNGPGALKKQVKYTKQLSTANTFAAVAEEFVDKRKREGVAEVTISKIEWILSQKLCPRIGGIPVAEIKPLQLLSALRPIEQEGLHETANRAKRV